MAPSCTHFRSLSRLQQTSSAEITYEGLPPTRSSINAPLVNNRNWQHQHSTETNVSDCVCNTVTVARIFATLLSGGYCGVTLSRLWQFIKPYNIFRGDTILDYSIAGALFLAAISGSLGTFIAGCIMACRKSCCCKSSITRLAMVQFIGGAACMLAEFGWMIWEAVRCRNPIYPPGNGILSDRTNNNMSNTTYGPEMAGWGNATPPVPHSVCFQNLYWDIAWGYIDFPTCVVLLLCTCVSAFKK